MLFAELIEVADPEPHSGALNMAIDEVLLRQAELPVLRIYHWAQPAVSFGYFGAWAAAEKAWPRRELARRWTGGGIVPHGSDFTYTLIVPASVWRASPSNSYRLIHEQIAALLQRAGVVVKAAPQAGRKISEACFENSAEHDLLMSSQKIAGAAQRRTRFGLLHQGSIQMPQYRDLLKNELAHEFSEVVNRCCLNSQELAAAGALAEEKYATDDWLKRR